MFYDRYSRRGGDLEDLDLILKERRENAPQPLPHIYPQAPASPISTLPWFVEPLLQLFQLWLPSTGNNSRPFYNQASYQEQCALVSKLPPEIRQMVWKRALGGKLLHITRAKKRLLAIECPTRCPIQRNIRSCTCWGLKNRNTRLFPGHYIRPHPNSIAMAANLLSLPRTCQVM